MKYQIITYGCQFNETDSERIANILEKIEYRPASKINEADLVVINMCSVRQSAVDRIYGKINQISKIRTQNNKLKIILSGCILPEDKKKLEKKVDLILNIKDLANWPKILKKRIKPSLSFSFFPSCNFLNYLKIKPKYQNNFKAYIPISSGCNNFCSYCVVPYVRGSLICRDPEEILEEIKEVIKKGFKEIWLLGQNVNHYSSKRINFEKLLKMANEIDGDFWIRFTSPHPADFSDGLIKTIAQCKKVTPYLHLPVQSGDNEILKKMNRNYTIEKYKEIIKKIRKAFIVAREGLEKEISLSTDVIVGFPGEREEQFKKTLKLFKEIKYDMAYIARYSPRSGTTAAKLKDEITSGEKKRRWRILTNLLKKISLEKNKKYLNKIIEVLPEERKKEWLIGKTRHYKTIKFSIPDFQSKFPKLFSQIIKVRVVNVSTWGLKGKIIDNLIHN